MWCSDTDLHCKNKVKMKQAETKTLQRHKDDLETNRASPQWVVSDPKTWGWRLG